MSLTKRTVVLVLVATLGLSACSRDKLGTMMNLRSEAGPDEFAILPTKPLEIPKDIAALPEPTPGGTNLTDPTPELDATAALGGKPKLVTRKGIENTGIVAVAGRYGIAEDIRETLAEEDVEFRKENPGRLLERWFRVTTYFRSYEEQSLDSYAELRRLRRSGVRTPAVPPEAE